MLNSVPTSTVKIVVYVNAVIATLYGIVIIVFSAFVKSDEIGVQNDLLNADNFAIISMVVGCLLIFQALVMVCATLRESNRLLNTEFVLILIAVILQLAAFVLLVISVDPSFMKNRLRRSLNDYGNDYKQIAYWEQTQLDFKCCGINSYTDFESRDLTLPSSCCQAKPADAAKAEDAVCKALGQNLSYLREDDCFEKLTHSSETFYLWMTVHNGIFFIYQLASLEAVAWLAEVIKK